MDNLDVQEKTHRLDCKRARGLAQNLNEAGIKATVVDGDWQTEDPDVIITGTPFYVQVCQGHYHLYQIHGDGSHEEMTESMSMAVIENEVKVIML